MGFYVYSPITGSADFSMNFLARWIAIVNDQISSRFFNLVYLLQEGSWFSYSENEIIPTGGISDGVKDSSLMTLCVYRHNVTQILFYPLDDQSLDI